MRRSKIYWVARSRTKIVVLEHPGYKVAVDIQLKFRHHDDRHSSNPKRLIHRHRSAHGEKIRSLGALELSLRRMFS